MAIQLLHAAMFDGVPQHLVARCASLAPPHKSITRDFAPAYAILKRVCLDLESNAWQRKPTVTSLELRLRHASSQSELAKSGQIDCNITAILQKHQELLTADEIYQCCVLVFGESHPHTRYMLANRGMFHFTYASKILDCSKLTPDNIRAALSQLLKSADLNEPHGILTLAELYEHGLGDTIAKDPVEALRWRVRYAKLDLDTVKPDNSMCPRVKLAAISVQDARKRLLSMQQSVD